MILRKPYAYIIKHFRLIHLIILATILFSIYTIGSMSGLVSTLISSRVYTYAGAEVYINKTIYTFILISLFLSTTVFWLLRQKKKPTNLYLGLIVYNIVSLVGYIYIYSVLNKMITVEVSIDTLQLLRDLLLLIRLPGYVFAGFCLIRGIGFNLKQFNFSKDIEELKIAEKDSEEFELIVGQNNYKYVRFIRRTIRELKYYVLENLVPIIIVGIVLLAILGILGFRYYNQYLKKLKAQEVKTINGITYVVNNAYITTEDFNGNKVKDGSKFVIVDMSFNNTTTEDKTLNYNKIKLNYKELIWSATTTYNSNFYDMGVPYDPDTILPKSQMIDRTIIFEIPETTNTNNFTLRIEYGITNKEKSIISNYIKFEVNCRDADVEDKQINISLNEFINTNVLDVNKFQLKVKNYNIQENFNSKYVVCDKDYNCVPYHELISANGMDNKTMLVLDVDDGIYEDAKFSLTFNSLARIVSNYAYISYIESNREYVEKVSLVPQANVEGKVFLLVDRRVLKASNLKLMLKFRNDTYIINLK